MLAMNRTTWSVPTTDARDDLRPCVHQAAVSVAAEVARRMWPGLSYADMFLTEDCNHRCSYCFVKGKNPRRMSEQIARDALEFLLTASKETKQVRILFFGGEPLLEFGLIRYFVEHGRKRFAEAGKELGFDITTNGTLMTDEMAAYFRANGVMVLLSIDGDQETHDTHRTLVDGGSSFQAVMERVPLLRRYQPWQGTRLTVHPDTAHKLRHNVEHLYGCGINQFIIGPATGIEWSAEALQTYEDQMCLVADLYKDMQARKQPFRMTLFEKDLECELRGVWGCGAGRGRICISAEGQLYGCAKILGVDGLRDTHRLGDLWNGITNLPARRDLLNIHPSARPRCATCGHADECAGGCPATNYEATGDLFRPAPLECQLVPIIERIKARMGEPGGSASRTDRRPAEEGHVGELAPACSPQRVATGPRGAATSDPSYQTELKAR